MCGIKSYGKQNYLCKNCQRQFICGHNLTYKGWTSHIAAKILLLLARNIGIRDIAEIKRFSIKRNKKTAQKLRDKLKDLGVSYDEIFTDNWEGFVLVFQ